MQMDLLRKIPNLRKISASPWNDVEKMAEEVAGDYVFSHKPNPAVLAPAREELRNMLQAAGKNGCHVEIIMSRSVSGSGHGLLPRSRRDTAYRYELYRSYSSLITGTPNSRSVLIQPVTWAGAGVSAVKSSSESRPKRFLLLVPSR